MTFTIELLKQLTENSALSLKSKPPAMVKTWCDDEGKVVEEHVRLLDMCALKLAKYNVEKLWEFKN